MSAPAMPARPLAVVTGSLGTIGSAITQALLDDGYQVIGLDRQACAAQCTFGAAAPGAYAHVQCDLADAEALRAACARVLGPQSKVALLVNNAALAASGRLLDLDDEVWRLTMEVNLNAIFTLSRAAIGAMVERGCGAIINIASIDGIGRNNNIAYASAKAALMRFTEVSAMTYGKFGVRANCVVPGFVDSAMLHACYSADRLAQLRRQIPLRRFAQPDEIANVVRFLASPAASYINGSHLRVDGGYLL